MTPGNLLGAVLARQQAESQEWQDRCLKMQAERDEARGERDIALRTSAMCAPHPWDAAREALLIKARAEVERLTAALEEVRGLTKCATDVFLIQISSVAAQALYPDWRDGGVKP